MFVKSSNLGLRVFLVWLISDVACLAVGTQWTWLRGVGVWGLGMDFLFGILILGQYLHDNGKL
jgi:hypothetical protein